MRVSIGFYSFLRGLERGFAYLIVLAVVAVVLAFTLGCIHRSPQEIAVRSYHSVHTALGTVQDVEHGLCDPAIPLDQPVTACTDLAHKIGLSDAKHVAFNEKMADLFTKDEAYNDKLHAWISGPIPQPVDLKTTIEDLMSFVKAMGPPDAIVRLINAIQAVITTLAAVTSPAGGGAA